MNEDYCSYELSKALKKCGFDEPCDHYWYKVYTDSDKMEMRQGKTMDYNNDDWFVPHCSAPTLWQVQKWLREKWGIYAYCEPNCLKKWFARAIDLAKNEDLLFDGEMFDSFEKATEYAISAALELIKGGE